MSMRNYRILFAYPGSHRMAFISLLLAVSGLLLRLVFPQQGWLSDGPFYFLAACLALSMLYHWQRFIARPMVLLFHLGLLGTLGALLMSPLFRASGYFELAEGQTTRNQFIVYEQGRFAQNAPTDWQLTQHSIHADYRYGSIGNTIHSELFDAKNRQTVTIGFMQAAHIDGYRIEPTGNMGYAAVLTYIDTNGKQHRGVVNFPGYPTQKIQSNPFRGPNGQWINIGLEMGDWPYRDKQAWALDIPDSVRIKLKTEQTSFVLKPGEEQILPSGKLKLEKVSRWLGYRITRDPFAPFILVSSLLCCLSLTLHRLQSRKIGLSKWHSLFSTSA